MSESSFKRSLVSSLVKSRAFFINSSFSITRGIPDLIISYNGVLLVLELKMKGGVLTALQMDSLVCAASNGARSFVVTLDDTKKVVVSLRIKEDGSHGEVKSYTKKQFIGSFPGNMM